MQKNLQIGSNGYIIESNHTVIKVMIVAQHGDFYVLQLPTGGAIKLRESRIFLTKEEAESKIPHKVQIGKAYQRSPYYYGL